MHYIYLLLILFTLSYPLLKSFEDKIQFYRKWKYLFPAIFICAVIFIAWDVCFVHLDVWKFNYDYLIGIRIINLPLEECLFFFIIPFSTVFIYEVMNYFVKKDVLTKQSKLITNILIIILLITTIVYSQHLYTFLTFLSLSIFLIIHQYILKSNYLGRYYISWAVCLVPFLIVDGVLTAMPVLIYNDKEIIGLHIFTIPLEDIFYGMLQFLLVITIYEWLKNKGTKFFCNDQTINFII